MRDLDRSKKFEIPIATQSLNPKGTMNLKNTRPGEKLLCMILHSATERGYARIRKIILLDEKSLKGSFLVWLLLAFDSCIQANIYIFYVIIYQKIYIDISLIFLDI